MAKEMTLTGRQSKIPVGEVLTIHAALMGSVGGSETGEQRCAQLHATASNCEFDKPSDRQTCTSGACSDFFDSINSEMTSSLTRKRSLVQSQYRPQVLLQVRAGLQGLRGPAS